MSLGYCGSCGEPVEGRFCRMCGAPYAPVPAEAVAATVVHSAQSPYQQTQQVHRATHAQPPESDFESLFRPPEGQVSPHGRTQVMRPVQADYRMPPPAPAGPQPGTVSPFGTAPTQVVHPRPGDGHPPGPGRNDEDWDDDEPRGIRKPVVWATAAAVAVASAIILGLIYIGNHNGAHAAGDGATTTPTTPSSAQQTVTSVDLAPGSASPSASASASPTSAQGSTTLPLSIGSTGQYVHYVQTRLRQLGYYHGSVTSHYDQATAQAVTKFQDRAEVTGDPSGTVGRSTLTALLAAGSQPNLHVGQRSGDVRRLQEALNSAENAGLTITGRYDAATFAAVGHYQQQIGVDPTGSMDQETWDALQSGKTV